MVEFPLVIWMILSEYPQASTDGDCNVGIPFTRTSLTGSVNLLGSWEKSSLEAPLDAASLK